ncbi:putative cysteine peptidase [Spiroplasma alleghenense]|uniref:Peptidase C39-like domain-containing protein n=1 Tax=Spiroplasma alleghenense TaxID=216931 RepID=A0A345Z4I1_9MOLU|nr:hypothetical protein [Spiroplasma alleghenense]AXK51510.1 hypothetical protein SALLE_v1c08400 [Spiroplasma alleghenense]
MKKILLILSSLLISAPYITNAKNSIETQSKDESSETVNDIPDYYFKSAGGEQPGDPINNPSDLFYENNQTDFELVPNFEWFFKLKKEESFGYSEARYREKGKLKKGLCEYNSLAMILTYLELFVTSEVINDDNFRKYFDFGIKEEGKIQAPIHRYSFKEYETMDSSLASKLWNLNNFKLDLLVGGSVQNTFNKWIQIQSREANIANEYSASFWHTSSPEDNLLKHRVPVMMSWTKHKHNIVIFGYNKSTDSYVVHYGWPDSQPIRIIKKSLLWSTFSGGFWNAFYPNPNKPKQALKKRFKYQGELYSWTELERMGKTANDFANMEFLDNYK